jgi:cell wall-associated NlpC family hydrolase
MFGTKLLKSVALGRAQGGGLESPHLPGSIVRLGRFFMFTSGTWITVCWYTGYVNARTAPGSGPKLVIAGPVISTVDRPDRNPKFAANANTGSNLSLADQQAAAAAGQQAARVAQGVVGALGSFGGTARLNAARVAKSMVGRGNFRYAEVRPMPNSLTSNPCTTDCSGFVTLIYKAIGAADPNGTAYNGSGYTGTLMKNGIEVKRADIADLAFWQNPDHVAIVVGTGTDPQIVQFGGPPSPVKSTVQSESPYHESFLGFRSYLNAAVGAAAAGTTARGNLLKGF